MKKKLLILLFLLIVILLRSETMIVHTTSGDYTFEISNIDEIIFDDSTGISKDFVEFISKVPIQFLKNFPNPFNPVTQIQFELNQSGRVSVEIFNVKGQKVKTILNEDLEHGKHSLLWKGTNKNERRVTSGVYFYKVSCDGEEKINKMIMMK
ncbi:MAG: T9SS type A sorting domain-containing protein [Candidatus Cloacimonetes bacterium]|nr:T9SS type A sorting domain-containing protein [Candidatus Cloacimonadota bacterium]